MQSESKELFKHIFTAIFVGVTEKFLKARIEETGRQYQVIDTTVSLLVLKEALQDYCVFADPNIVLLADVKGVGIKKFASFLKFLENYAVLRIWFYGVPLDVYPMTIISRCQVIVSSDRDAELKAYLKENNLVELSGSMGYLKHYDFDFAMKMVRVKQHFVSFLLGLQNFTYRDYHLLTINEKTAKEFLYLFYEWLNQNELFSKKEQQYCPELRDSEFLKRLYSAVCDKSFYAYNLPFLISCQARK